MSDQPNTSDNGDRLAVPFMPALRKRLDLRLSPPTTELVLTDSPWSRAPLSALA